MKGERTELSGGHADPRRGRKELTGRVVLVTGGSSGIGAATARRLTGSGAQVVITARDSARLRAAPADTDAVPADLTVAGDREWLIQQVIERYGRLDALVNNAAVGRVGMLTDLDADDITDLVTLNLIAATDLTRLALPHLLRSRGDLVMVTSGVAWFPSPPLSLYSASKAGLHGLVTALRREQPRSVRIHEIQPGLVSTEWLPYALGWRPTPDRPHAATTIGIRPDRVAAEIATCLTARSSRTVTVPRKLGAGRLMVLPPVNRAVDRLGPHLAPRLVAWARRYGITLANRSVPPEDSSRT